MPDLNIEKHAQLRRYLRRNGYIDHDEEPQFRTLDGGVSNRTVLVQRPTGEAWVLKQALEKLRVPIDWFSNPKRIHREALGLRWLADLAPAGTIPEFIFEDRHEHVLAMEAIPEPHENWKLRLLSGRLEGEHVEKFARMLAAIHRSAYARRDEVAVAFHDRSFFESLRLEPYYRYTATQLPSSAPFLQTLIDETRARRITLVHGDYSPKNILVYDGTLILLDHEVIHFGDPAFDLGFSLTHLLSKAHHVVHERDAFADAACRYWQVYREALGDYVWTNELEAYAVRHTLGCLLARVDGRSRLEYFSTEERIRQRDTVVPLMKRVPASIPGLVTKFVQAL